MDLSIPLNGNFQKHLLALHVRYINVKIISPDGVMKRVTFLFNSGSLDAITMVVNLMLDSMECSVDASVAASSKTFLIMALKKLAHRSKCVLLVKFGTQYLGSFHPRRTILRCIFYLSYLYIPENLVLLVQAILNIKVLNQPM